MIKMKQAIILIGIMLALSSSMAKAQSNSGKTSKKSGSSSPTSVDPSKLPATPKTAPDPTPADYVIGEQDVLDIDVWQEKELTGPAVVRSDGKITLPLVGEVYVVGMTPLQLETELTKRFEPFITVPQVTVAVHEINSRKVYLLGEVTHEGVYRINSTTTVSQILTQAGGLREYAKRSKIYVLRKKDGKQIRLPFNYSAFVKGKKNGQDFALQPGDTVVVP
jgi:polysaccharide export outer membrane protein